MNTSGDWVDFRLVKEIISMKDLLDHYHVNWLRQSNDELRGRCPIHQGEEDRSFHVNLGKNIFNCFSCKARGNILDFAAAMEKCTVRKAALKLKEWFQVGECAASGEGTPALTTIVGAKNDIGVINPPLTFQLRIDHHHPYGLSRGVSRETLEYFGAGYCLSKGSFAGRFIIPLHNEQGGLVGYAGRSVDNSKPKYLVPSNDKGFFKSHLLFNLHRVLKEASSTDPLVVVEGFFDCMKVAQCGFHSVALFGSSMSEEQEALIIENFNRVVLLFDGDAAGRQGNEDCALRLSRSLWVRTASLPPDVQADQLTKKELHHTLAFI
jgi:DNA primase